MDAARIVRYARERAGLTLRELADRAGTSNSTLSAYESGRVVPRADTLARVVEASGCHLVVALDPSPHRDPHRLSPGEELWQAMLLAQMLPLRDREAMPQTPHAIFART